MAQQGPPMRSVPVTSRARSFRDFLSCYSGGTLNTKIHSGPYDRPDDVPLSTAGSAAPYGQSRALPGSPDDPTMWDIRCAEKARAELKNEVINGRRIDCQFSHARNDRVRDGNTGTLYVRPVTSDRQFVDPNGLELYHELFSQYGEIKKVSANRKREAEKFIEYYDLRSAENALTALNGRELNGVVLEIQFANHSSKTINMYSKINNTRSSYGYSSGGGGSYGGGGGGGNYGGAGGGGNYNNAGGGGSYNGASGGGSYGGASGGGSYGGAGGGGSYSGTGGGGSYSSLGGGGSYSNAGGDGIYSNSGGGGQYGSANDTAAVGDYYPPVSSRHGHSSNSGGSLGDSSGPPTYYGSGGPGSGESRRSGTSHSVSSGATSAAVDPYGYAPPPMMRIDPYGTTSSSGWNSGATKPWTSSVSSNAQPSCYQGGTMPSGSAARRASNDIW